MAAASENITAWLDWDDHLLDFLLIGWIGWAALVVVVVNSVLTFFGPLQPRGDFVIRTKEGATGAKVVAGTGGAESCLWLNSALNWFYLHYDKFPEFVDVWVKALNDQSAKLGGPVQVKFERVKSGSLPPKFSEVTFEAGPEDKYVVTCKTDSRDLSLAVFASQQTAEGVKLTNLTTNILKLKGTLKMKCFRDGSDMMVNVSFEGRPDVKVVGKPVNPYQDPNDLVDVGVVETVVRNAICLTSSNFNISKLLTGGSYGNLSPRIMADAPLSPGNRSPSNLSPRTEAVFEPIEVKEVQQSAFHSPGLLASAPRPSRPSPGEKRLLVKVIKASALGGRDVGSIDPTCVVILDSPPQTQATSVVKSTVNPFWDEQFLFDVSGNTRELKFEVRDRRRPAADNFLGEAYVYYEDLKRTPSSRQIIPLQGSPDIRGDMVTGSITVEFLFLDAIEAETVRQTIAAMSPKRTVEVNQAKTPGGTLVTKTTTTTERARHGRQGAQVDGSPNYIEKHTNMYDYEGSDSTSQSLKDRSVSSSSELLHINGVESVAETAIRELMDRSRKPRTPTKTSTLIITGVKRASTKPSEEITELPSAVTVPQAESSPVTETPSAVTVPQAESSPVTETPSAVTVPQAESSPVEETALSSDAVVEHFQQSSNTPSHTAKPLTPPTSECGFKPEISAQAESFPESSFPKFTPLGMHPPAEVKSFPDKKKDTSPNFESENKIAEMLSEPTPTIDLLDKNIVFEISYSLGDPEPTPTVFQLDSSHDMPTEDVQHKPDLISDSEIQSGHGASSEIPFASSSDREITSEVSSVPASDKDIGEDVNCVLSSGEDSSEQLTFLSTEIESSQDVEYDAAPQPIKESEKVNTHTEVDSCQEVALKSTCVEAVAHSRSPSPFADEVDSCQEVALTSSCVEVVAHSRSPSPFADDSSCSSFHDDEYISHSSTEDLADGTSPHYFKSMEVEASEWPEASTDTCLMSEKAFTETSHGEATAAVEQLEEDSAVTEKVFTQDLSVDVTHSPEPLEETEPEECAAVISKVFTPEPSDSLTFPPKTLEENDNDGAECAAVVADMFTPDSSEKLEISSDSITEDNIEEYAAVAAKVFTPESSEELELSPDPLKETDIEPLAETETEPVEYAAIAAKVFTPEPEEEPELLPEPLKETDIEPLAETETEPVEYAAIAAKVFTPEPEEEPELLPEPLKETDIEPLAETETEPVEYAAVAAKLFTPEPEEEPELLPEPLKETDIEPLAETETEPVEYAAVAAKMFTPEPDGLEPLKETDNEPLAETETEPVEYETVAAKMFTPEPKELEPLNETDNEPLGETETEPVEYEAVAARVFTPEPSDELELSPEPEAIAAVAPAQHSAVTSKILPESMVYTKGAHEEQAEAALTEHGQCSSSENVLLTKVEPSTQFVLEEATTSCPLLPAERVLAAQKIPSTETVLSETMPIETTLSADSIVQIEVESSDHCLSQTAKIDEDILLTEVEPSEQIAAEETTIPCSSVPAERLLASHTVSAVETVLSETLARETRLPADKLVQTEIKPSEEMSLEEAVLSSPSIPAERLLAAQKDSETETVLSETMPIETLLSVDASTVDVSAVVSREADIISSEYVVETEETPVVHTSKERAVSLEETEHPAVFSTRDTIVSTEQDYKEDDLSDYDDLPEDIPSDFLIEEMTEVLEVDTEDLAKFPVSIGDDLTDTHMDFEPVVVEPVHEDCEVEEAEDRTPTESMDQGEGIVTEDPCGETDIPSSDLMSVDRSGGEVNSELESEVSVAASDEAMPDKPLQLDLVSIPLLEEMEQIVSDMSSLAEDISKSPVLASDEFPFQPPCTTTDVVDQPSTEADIAEETPSSVTCHSAEVSMARDGAQEMSSEDTESSPVESLTPTPDDLDHSCHQSDLETAMVTVETFAGETALQPIKPQAIEETALEFSLASREEKASVSSVSDIIQDLPAHSTVTEQEPIVLQSSAVSVDVVTVSDPTPEELSAVDDLLQEVSDYSQLQHGSSGHDEGEDVYLTGQFVSEPVSEAELAAEACFVEDTRSHHVEGLSVNVFVTTDRETPEPSSPLAKYDVIEDLSVSIDEPFTVEDDETLESSILSVDATTEDISTRSDDVPSTVGSFDIPANAALEDLSIRPDTSFASENLPTEEVTSAFPAAEADISTEYEVSIPTQSEEKDDDSPAMRAILRRQNYLAEQAKKKELFEGSGRIEHDGAVDSCEKLVEILPVVGSELPQCLSCSDPMETKPTEGKVTTTSMYVDIKPCVQPFDNVPKTIVVQVESTEIAGPPKELVSDLMSGNRIATSPETYASLSRPLRVYKQVSSDIEDDTSKVIQKRVDDWVATTTDNVVATTPESSTVQTPVPSSQQPGSVILPQMTENIQVSPQLLSENVQSVHKTGFVIRPQVVENVQPSSENVKIVQRPGFATSRKTVENINIDPQPQPEYVQIVQRPGFAMSRQTVENINIDPQPENVQIVQRPGFAMTRQTAENINIDPQPQPENVQIVQRPGFAMSRQPAENINIDPQPQPENVQIVQRPGFAMSRQTDKNINIDPQPQTENVQIVQRPGFAMPLTVENLPHIPQPLSDNVQLPHEPESAENPDVEDVQISPETLADVESVPASGRVYRPKKYNTLPHPSKSSKDASTPKRAGSVPRSSSSADKHRKTTQSSPTEEANSDIPTVKMDPPTSGQEEKEKKKGSSLARTLKKRFSRSKKRSKSAERSRDDSHLQPPGQSYGQAQSKDDIELVRAQQDTPSLKKSRSLGGSLKKLFRRGRKRSRDQGETSRESSYSRSSTRNASQGPSREGSITRGGGPTSSLTRSGQLPDQKGEVGRSHWSRSNTQPTSNEYMEREVDVSPRHQPGDTTYPVLQQEPTVIQPRGISSHEPDVGRGHWSRPKSGEQLDVARQTYDTNSAPPESNTAPEDVRRGHWSKSKSPARGGAVIITSPKQEPLDVVSPSYDTMAAPPDTDEKPEVRRGHWSKSKSPARSAGGMVITSTRQEVPDLVSSSSTKVVTAEVNGKTKSLEKIEAPIQSGPVVVKQRESTEVDTNDKPVTMTTTAEVSDVQSDVRRGHWSKSKSPNRDRIGQIVVSKDPIIAVPVADADVRKGHWTKSKSKSPKREWAPPSGIETSVPDSQSPSDVHPSSTTESSDNIKVKAKPTRVEPVKSKPVKVVPVKAKPTKVESTVQEPVPEDLIVPPPPSAKKGHWSKTATDLNQPMGGGVIVVTTDPAEIPVVPVEPVDVRRGHWTKPKTQTS